MKYENTLKVTEDERLDVGPSFAELLSSYHKGISEVPILKEVFFNCSSPTNWGEWKNLPVTSTDTYSDLKQNFSALRNHERLLAIAAPMRLSTPQFPLAIAQSYNDKLVLDTRLQFIMAATGISDHEDFLFVVDRDFIYSASDLSELLIYLGYTCDIIYSENLNETELGTLLSNLEAQCLIWMTELPPSEDVIPDKVAAIWHFNSNSKNKWSRLKSVEVIHLDILPYMAFRDSRESYRVPPGHFYLEEYGENELLVTTLSQDMIPLIRFRTELKATLTANGFMLLNDR